MAASLHRSQVALGDALVCEAVLRLPGMDELALVCRTNALWRQNCLDKCVPKCNLGTMGMSIQALTRKISPYDGPDLFLGLFTDPAKAFGAREAYLRSISSDDPWRKQSYRVSQPDEDVCLIEVADHRTNDKQEVVLLVTAYFDGMGQQQRRFLAVFSEKEAAEKFAVDKESGPYETTPNWCDVDKVVLNATR